MPDRHAWYAIGYELHEAFKLANDISKPEHYARTREMEIEYAEGVVAILETQLPLVREQLGAMREERRP